jgi:hypothetical protein
MLVTMQYSRVDVPVGDEAEAGDGGVHEETSRSQLSPCLLQWYWSGRVSGPLQLNECRLHFLTHALSTHVIHSRDVAPGWISAWRSTTRWMSSPKRTRHVGDEKSCTLLLLRHRRLYS